MVPRKSVRISFSQGCETGIRAFLDAQKEGGKMRRHYIKEIVSDSDLSNPGGSKVVWRLCPLCARGRKDLCSEESTRRRLERKAGEKG